MPEYVTLALLSVGAALSSGAIGSIISVVRGLKTADTTALSASKALFTVAQNADELLVRQITRAEAPGLPGADLSSWLRSGALDPTAGRSEATKEPHPEPAEPGETRTPKEFDSGEVLAEDLQVAVSTLKASVQNSQQEIEFNTQEQKSAQFQQATYFWLSVGGAVAGTAVVILGAIVALQGTVGVGVFTSISGALPGAVAALMFKR